MTRTFRMFRGLAAGTAIAACLANASLAAAQDGSDSMVTAHRSIDIDGLDLTTQAGQAELNHRIIHAARLICAELGNGMDFADADFRDCTREAYARAWRQAQARIAEARQATNLASTTPK